jgi:hypothetical protein
VLRIGTSPCTIINNDQSARRSRRVFIQGTRVLLVGGVGQERVRRGSGGVQEGVRRGSGGGQERFRRGSGFFIFFFSAV